MQRICSQRFVKHAKFLAFETPCHQFLSGLKTGADDHRSSRRAIGGCELVIGRPTRWPRLLIHVVGCNGS